MNPAHNVTGRCGVCGGAVVKSMFTSGTAPAEEFCQDCGRRARPLPPPSVPVREMIVLDSPLKTWVLDEAGGTPSLTTPIAGLGAGKTDDF